MQLPRRPPTLRQLLWRELALVSAIFVPLLVAVCWIGYVQVLDLQAAMLSRQARGSLEARLSDRLDRIHRGAELLAALWREGVVDPARANEAGPHLLRLLRSLPGSGNILLVRSPDGVATVGLRDPPHFAIEGLQPLADGTTQFTQVDYDRDRDDMPALGTRVFVNPYRPLERPWVEQVKAAGGPTWTEPYLFANFLGDGAPRVIGITYGAPVHRDGALLGYVGVDLLLPDLDALAAAVRPTQASRVAILDDKGQLLGASSPEARRTADGASSRRESLLLQAMPGHPWRITLSIPDSELSGPTRRQLALLGAALLLLFSLAVLRMRTVGARIVRALRELALAADQLGTTAPTPALAVPVTELATLRDALERAHHGVLERRSLDNQLQHSQRVGLVGFLAGGLAHDINNQLTAIIGGISAARACLPQDAAAADRTLAEVEEACWRSVDMTRGMLHLNRRGAPNFEPVDVNEVVSHTASLVTHLLDKKVKVELRLGAALAQVRADRVQLEQVLLNLALNSRDAMPAGGILRFETAAAEPGGVQISVADTGTGMPPEVQSRIFEPFFTTKEPGKGTGLGLAMVSSIARSHGGLVEVHSEVGKGSVFRIRLRRNPPHPPRNEAPAVRSTVGLETPTRETR